MILAALLTACAARSMHTDLATSDFATRAVGPYPQIESWELQASGPLPGYDGAAVNCDNPYVSGAVSEGVLRLGWIPAKDGVPDPAMIFKVRAGSCTVSLGTQSVVRSYYFKAVVKEAG